MALLPAILQSDDTATQLDQARARLAAAQDSIARLQAELEVVSGGERVTG